MSAYYVRKVYTNKVAARLPHAKPARLDIESKLNGKSSNIQLNFFYLKQKIMTTYNVITSSETFRVSTNFTKDYLLEFLGCLLPSEIKSITECIDDKVVHIKYTFKIN